MKLFQMADPVRYARMTSDELRSTFLVETLFAPGRIELAYVDLDRAVIGSAVPMDSPLELKTHPELRAAYFLERRELGIFNVGGPGTVLVDDISHDLDKLDTLYVGRGSRRVTFRSKSTADPAAFYLLSYPAHAEFPTTKVRLAEITPVELGSLETCNRRKIYKTIHLHGIRSSQLVMGFTLLETGSNWNTMPPHVHMRRSEIYFYFDVEPDQRVIHLMGPPQSTRHLVVADRQAVVSPGWSIHAGVGTKAYGFCWGMGGENQDYADMDGLSIKDLR